MIYLSSVHKSDHFPVFLEGIKLFHSLKDSGHGVWMQKFWATLSLFRTVSSHTILNVHSALLSSFLNTPSLNTFQGQVKNHTSTRLYLCDTCHNML